MDARSHRMDIDKGMDKLEICLTDWDLASAGERCRGPCSKVGRTTVAASGFSSLRLVVGLGIFVGVEDLAVDSFIEGARRWE